MQPDLKGWKKSAGDLGKSQPHSVALDAEINKFALLALLWLGALLCVYFVMPS